MTRSSKTRSTILALAASVALAAGSTATLAQVGTAFTYQGQLKNSGNSVNSPTDMQFSLWTAASGGSQIGTTVTQTNVSVSEGLFSTSVDFGVNPYTSNQALWLQIAVRNPAGGGAYVAMGSRQRLTPSPFSLATRGINVDALGRVTFNPTGPGSQNDQSFTVNAANGGMLQTLAVSNGGFQNRMETTLDASSAGNPGAGFIRMHTPGLGYGSLTLNETMTLVSGRNSGNVGIGTPTPVDKLSIVGGALSFGSATLPLGGMDYDSTTDALRLRTNIGSAGLNTTALSILRTLGNVGIGVPSPAARLDVRLPNNNAGTAIVFGSPTYAMGRLGEDSSTNSVVVANAYFSATVPSSVSLDFRVGGTAPSDTKAKVRQDGVFEVKTLQINGGSDLVEGFDSQAKDIEPGTLMVIDPAHPGELIPSTSAYDSKVAGIVSGAGGVNPGIKMGQDGVMDGKHPIAMTGRVYVKATAAAGSIKPGDLLTTSDVPGHAMKATDTAKSDGTIIGKAMSALDKDTGLVLVLVNLQ